MLVILYYSKQAFFSLGTTFLEGQEILLLLLVAFTWTIFSCLKSVAQSNLLFILLVYGFGFTEFWFCLGGSNG